MESPSTDNYTLGKGVVYFDQLISGAYTGERDLGNAPAFTFNITLEKLDHFSSRGGLKAKDLELISQLSPSCAFTLDELNKENFSLLSMATENEVVQALGGASAEEVTAYVGRRSILAKRQVQHWTLPYDDDAADNVLFVVGETITGAGGATGIVLKVTGTATTGTFLVARTNATSFIDDEVLTGGTAGIANVNSATGGTAGTGAPFALVQDDTDTTTYTEGTDYEISTTLKDDVIGRIHVIDGGSITEGETLHVTYGYGASTYTELQAFTQTSVEGFLRFVSDNPAGNQQELKIWRCSLTPSGDTAMIGEEWSTLAFTGEILKDESGHPDSPYMDIVMA